jgi:hypothetical protein
MRNRLDEVVKTREISNEIAGVAIGIGKSAVGMNTDSSQRRSSVGLLHPKRLSTIRTAIPEIIVQPIWK